MFLIVVGLSALNIGLAVYNIHVEDWILGSINIGAGIFCGLVGLVIGLRESLEIYKDR